MAQQFFGADQAALQQWFSAVDKDRSGTISVAELQQALASGGLNFSMKLVSSMVRTFDADRSASFSMNEIVQLHGFLARIQAVFNQTDRDRRGVLDLNELHQAFAAMGYQLDRAPGGSYYTLCQSFDHDRCGKFSLERFVAMCVLLQNGKGVFDSFACGGPQVTLNFDQMVWAAALV